ncbi:hypothetical protein ACFY8P_35385 [Streptomyces sp. NPDC012693]|uniref:hypothetical protein n=1 Tax=Streptomyces sp. NPDC012693 TaxID=3364844 RepID=UPI003685C280
MTPRHDVRVLMENGTRRARIFLDGRELRGVQSVVTRHAYDAFPRVEIDLYVNTAAVEYVDNLDEHQEVSRDAAS